MLCAEADLSMRVSEDPPLGRAQLCWLVSAEPLEGVQAVVERSEDPPVA